MGTVSDTVVSSTYFHMLKILETDRSLIMRRKRQGPNFIPLDATERACKLQRIQKSVVDGVGYFGWRHVREAGLIQARRQT